MFRHIKDSISWANALSAMERGLYSSALVNLEKISGKRANKPEYHALLASCLLALNQHDRARLIFSNVAKLTAGIINDKDRYINLYANYYLNSIDGDEGGRIKILEQVVRNKWPKIIRQWLPLS